MPERIVSNLSALSKWREEIELAVVFWIIGATIGVGQHLLSPDPLSWRIAIGRALAPALEEITAFWKGSRILARILGTLAALGSLAVGAIVWSKEHIK